MTRLLVLALLLSTSPALAASDCGIYTLESRPPGERLATVEDGRVLTITDQYSGKEVYDLVSAGTGLPFMVAERQGEGDDTTLLEHKGDLIIDMMVFVPFCTSTP